MITEETGIKVQTARSDSTDPIERLLAQCTARSPMFCAQFLRRDDLSWKCGDVRIYFCPFCGEKLPT